MKVSDCIEYYKSNSKVKRGWLCPEIVPNPGFNKTYTCTFSLEYKPKSTVLDLEIKKHWIEDGTACMIYKLNGDPVVFNN